MQEINSIETLVNIRPGGSVDPYIERFAASLISTGYAQNCVRDYARSAAHLGRWMDTNKIAINQLADDAVARFTRHRCACPGVPHGRPPSRRSIARMRRFVAFLRSLGVVKAGCAVEPTPLPELLVGFREWMLRHRGATERTIDRYEDLIARMLPALGNDPGAFNATSVRSALLGEVRNRSCSYAKGFVSALRAFLRFHAAQGRCRPYLDRAVPVVRKWKLSALPLYLESDDVDRVIASCDLSKPCGVRDRAVLLLLARLGLRAGEVVGMRISDLDWKVGTIRVRGKGRKEIRLPVPPDVADALAAYLVDARPATEINRMFLCVNAPVRPLSGSPVVSSIVRLAIERAGILNPPSKGAHLLRHSAATAMLRSGASLDAVSAMLRHESSDMTAHYAKVDIELLQQVVQPWPGGTSC